MSSGIYAIRNNINGKVYVGQSTNIETRWIRHKSELRCHRHHNPHLQHAWDQYGESSFSIEILERVEEGLSQAETSWIESLHACDRELGYNILAEGSSMKGLKHSELTKAKMRKPRSELTRQTMRKPKSAEHKASMSRTQNNKNNAAKLNWEKVREIKARLTAGDTYVDIASDYNVSWYAIRNIHRHLRWANDPMEVLQ